MRESLNTVHVQMQRLDYESVFQWSVYLACDFIPQNTDPCMVNESTQLKLYQFLSCNPSCKMVLCASALLNSAVQSLCLNQKHRGAECGVVLLQSAPGEAEVNQEQQQPGVYKQPWFSGNTWLQQPPSRAGTVPSPPSRAGTVPCPGWHTARADECVLS